MKKYLAWALVIVTLLSLFAACTDFLPETIATPEPTATPEAEEPAEEEEIVIVDPSEWETAETPALTEETRALFDKAFAHLLGVHYVPVAYLGKQVVTGTVHTFLTRATVIYPGAKETYALVFLYEERDGSVRIIDICRSEVPTGMDEPAGFEQAEDPVLTEELVNGFREAISEIVGVEYTPVALCGTKVASGLSFVIVAESAPVVPEAETGYSFVYLDWNSQGHYTVDRIVDFDAELDPPAGPTQEAS